MGIANGRRYKLLLCAAALATLAGCHSTVEQPPERLKTFTVEAYKVDAAAPRCKALLDSYCGYLYSPEASGNLEIKRTFDSIKILQGETANQLSQVFFRYAEAKLKSQRNLPRDFHRALVRNNYFAKLRVLIERKPLVQMSLADRIAIDHLAYELNALWSAALNQTVITRMTVKYPGFHRLSEKSIPTELSLERVRVRRWLLTEVSRSIWKNDENWRRVEATFERLKGSYARLIASLELGKDEATEWQRQIADLQLILPGSLPSIADEECSSTKANAYYYAHLNAITVCAGDFNSEDILQTLAHEMGHALGIERAQYLFKARSKFGERIARLRQAVCQPNGWSCGEWEQFYKDFPALLESLNGFRPSLTEAQRCLKRRPTSKTLTDDDIDRFATNIVNDRISSLAARDRFLRITKAQIPMPNGGVQNNPNFLNPCSYYLWSQGEEPIDDELTTLLFFTASYRCSAESNGKKLRNGIEVAQQMSTSLLAKSLRIEGEFSARNELESGGFSSPPGERFADLIGSYAMADYLAHLNEVWDRRAKFLAGSSWLCSEPSLASHYPEENSIEKSFVFDSHAEDEQRRKELMSIPIRNTIQCEKDFEFNECVLPLKTSTGRDAR